MPVLPPPPPTFENPGSFSWMEWYRQLRSYVSQTGSVPWAVVDKAGSNLTDIVTRNHNNLQNIQGGSSGSYYHLQAKLTATLSAYDFASIAAHTTSTTTVTVTGAVTTNFAFVRLSTAAESGMVYDAYISAADTVTIRATNTTAAAIDPSSRDYVVIVIG
jgi:hypothetical protein